MFRQTIALVLATLASVSLVQAQTADRSIVFRSESTLVTVDVVVSGKNGGPANVAPSGWHVFENGREQHIASVEYESAAAEPASKLIGTGWSNNLVQQQKSSVSTGTTILLLDLLNTKPGTQQLARDAALRALRNLPGRERFILFLLGGDLKQVSGFTDDLSTVQELLKKQPIQNLQLLDKDPLIKGAFSNPVKGTDPYGDQNLISFENRVAANAASERIKRTLGALSRIADIVERQPGRKSLVWLTSSIPLSIVQAQADISAVGQSATLGMQVGTSTPAGADRITESIQMEDFSREVAKVSQRLSEARIAVYPILVNSLNSGQDVGSDVPFAATSDPLARQSNIFEYNGTNDRDSAIASAQLTARLTGGRATVNSNDIVGPFQRAVADADDYYTLSFVPDNTKLDGTFRKLEVRTSQPGVELHYRPGYYATPATANQPKQRLEQALVPDMLPSTGLELAARLKDRNTTLDLRVATNRIDFGPMADGRRKASLLVGYVIMIKNGAAPHLRWTPAEVTLDESQFAEAAQRGLPIVLPLQIPSGGYLSRAGVFDLVSGRLGTVDIGAAHSSDRVTPSPEPVPFAIDGEPVYPELGRLTDRTYENLFFNFTVQLPATIAEKTRLPLPPPGSHALLALSFSAPHIQRTETLLVAHPHTHIQGTGTLLIFAEEPSIVTSTDPQVAAAEEARLSRSTKDLEVSGPFDSSVKVCHTSSTECLWIRYFERRGYLLKFVAQSDSKEMAQRIAYSVDFSNRAAKHLPKPRELYTGPAIPSAVVEKAMMSPMSKPGLGTIREHVYSNPELGIQYTFPGNWTALPESEGLARFAELHTVPFGDKSREREHLFFQACSRTLLHLHEKPPNGNDDEAKDLELLVMYPACLGFQPLAWNDKDSVAGFAAGLSMLHDFGDVTSAHAQEISGRQFLTLEGLLSYSVPDSPLMKRLYQVTYLTADGEYLLAWFLTTRHPHPVDAFPAAQLEISNTK